MSAKSVESDIPNNTFIFSFVRMNPPTPGHLLLIKSLIDKAILLGVEKVYVMLSSSMDGKNPIPCSRDTIPKSKTKADGEIMEAIVQSGSVYKSTILEEIIETYKRQLIDAEPLEETSSASRGNRRAQIENVRIIVLCSTGNPFGFIYNVIKKDFLDIGIPKINMFFVVGRDRADFLDTIIDNFKTKSYVKLLDGEILDRTGMTELKTTGLSERKIEEIDPSAYSASFIRNLVKNGKIEDFNTVYRKFLPPETIQKMFETIQIGIQMKVPASKDEDENPKSKYFDNKLLPIIIESGGKRRTKTKKRKTKKRKTKKRNQRIYKK